MIELKEIIKPTISDVKEVIYLGKGNGTFWKYKSIWLVPLQSKSRYKDFANIDYYQEKLDILGEGGIKFLEKFLADDSVEFHNNDYQDIDIVNGEDVWVTKYRYYFDDENYNDIGELIEDLLTKLQDSSKNYFIVLGEK